MKIIILMFLVITSACQSEKTTYQEALINSVIDSDSIELIRSNFIEDQPESDIDNIQDSSDSSEVYFYSDGNPVRIRTYEESAINHSVTIGSLRISEGFSGTINLPEGAYLVETSTGQKLLSGEYDRLDNVSLGLVPYGSHTVVVEEMGDDLNDFVLQLRFSIDSSDLLNNAFFARANRMPAFTNCYNENSELVYLYTEGPVFIATAEESDINHIVTIGERQINEGFSGQVEFKAGCYPVNAPYGTTWLSGEYALPVGDVPFGKETLLIEEGRDDMNDFVIQIHANSLTDDVVPGSYFFRGGVTQN